MWLYTHVQGQDYYGIQYVNIFATHTHAHTQCGRITHRIGPHPYRRKNSTDQAAQFVQMCPQNYQLIHLKEKDLLALVLTAFCITCAVSWCC